MKRLQSRTIITLILTAALAAGVILFCVRLIAHGAEWVGFFGTTYYEAGAIYDSRGTLLFNGDTGEYAENQATRMATLHLVGDRNFGTSLRSALFGRLSGYNPVTGTTLGSHDVQLTIDASLNETALSALGGSRGVVAVYDYTNGAVKCLVSAPTYDPNDPPGDVNENPAYEGVYLNRFFYGTELEAFEDVVLQSLGGKEDDGHVGTGGTDLLSQCEAVLLRHHHVEHADVELGLEEGLEACLAVGTEFCHIAFSL